MINVNRLKLRFVLISSFIIITFTSLGQRKDSIWLKEERRFCNIVQRYYNNDNLADGKLIDYYPNGNIHIIGDFIWGNNRDTLQEFYPNGNLKYLEVVHVNYYDTSITLVTTLIQNYYSNGKVKRIRDTIKEIQYYPNGKKKMEQYKSSTMIANKFYVSGSPKIKIKGSVMNEYNEDSTLRLIISYSKKPTAAEINLKFKGADCTRLYSYIIINDRGDRVKGNVIINTGTYNSFFGQFPNLRELKKLVVLE